MNCLFISSQPRSTLLSYSRSQAHTAGLSVRDEILARDGIKQTDVYSDMRDRLKPPTGGPVAIFVNKDPILRDGIKVKSLLFSVSRRDVVFKNPNPDPEAPVCKNKAHIRTLIVHFS